MNNPGKLARRPRVLLLAYACIPERGSEPGVGWNRAVQTARHCDTWVLCEEGLCGAAIRRYLETHGPIPGLHFEFVLLPSWLRRLGRTPGVKYFGYNFWHRRALHAARRLHARTSFDLVHQVTFCGYREPGYLWQLGVPFVWGPVGGTQNYPWRFLGEANPRGALLEAFRSLINNLQLRFSPRVRRAAHATSALLAANSTVQRDFTRAHGVTPTLLLETGLHPVDAAPRPRAAKGGTLRLLWSGDLQPWKALSLLLKAMARLPKEVAVELRVLGVGPLGEPWQRLARRLGIAERVTWMGWLPHPEALAQYQWADVLLFTSLRDTSGNVVLEALGAGVPVICLDHQGVHDMVTARCGIKIPVTTPREVIVGLAAAITRLAHDPDQRYRLGLGALERAREYLWSRQEEQIIAVYQRVLRERFSRGPEPTPTGEPALSFLASVDA